MKLPKKSLSIRRLFVGLYPRWFAEVCLAVGSPSALFAVVPGVLNGLTHPVKLLPDHDLAQVVLFVAVVAAFTLVNILAHVFLLETCSSHGDGQG